MTAVQEIEMHQGICPIVEEAVEMQEDYQKG